MKSRLLISLLFILIAYTAISQSPRISSLPTKRSIGKNLLKMNLTGFMIRNYSFQAERLLSKRFSLAVAYRTMPEGILPFSKQLTAATGAGGSGVKNNMEEMVMANTALTPEVRIYFGKKGYGRGFYMAPFYRISDYSVKNAMINFNNSTNAISELSISGKVHATTYGLLLGAQWNLGSKVVLDWWMIGPQYGSATGQLNGVPGTPLTGIEMENLNDALGKINIPFTQTRTEVTPSKATLVMDGPWAGIRTGIVFGVRF
ncbi:MAG: hypothetical protein RL732_1303 [Bacteroidota bacterium]